MTGVAVEVTGLRELIKNLDGSSEVIKTESGRFLTKAKALYQGVIQKGPWKVGGLGGGAPVDTSYLRATHNYKVGNWLLRIKPTAPYSKAVHDGTKVMKARPWLDYAVDTKKAKVEKLEIEIIENITKQLAK